jgi:hypothetical protein
MSRTWILGECCETLSRELCGVVGFGYICDCFGWNMHMIWVVGYMAVDDYRSDMYENI